jgi:hypothetical protein
MKNTKTIADRGAESPSPADAELDALLAQLASTTSLQNAPSAVRQRLLAEARLQAELPLRPRPQFAIFLAGALSAALAILVLSGLLIGATWAGISPRLSRSGLSATLHAALHSLGIEKASSPSPALSSDGGDWAALPASGRVSVDDDFFLATANESSTPAAEDGSSSETAVSSEVFTLPDSDTMIANGTEATVRVSVPTSQLLAWGVPSPAIRGLDDEVPADLLLGDDGLPHAIRVLPASTTTSSTAEETYP